VISELQLCRKLGGRPEMVCNVSRSQSLTERLLEQLHRVERARASKPQPPTTFLLAPDRPPIRKPRPRPPPPQELPFHKLVKERIRRRKWLEEHPGEVGLLRKMHYWYRYSQYSFVLGKSSSLGSMVCLKAFLDSHFFFKCSIGSTAQLKMYYVGFLAFKSPFINACRINSSTLFVTGI